MKSLNIFLKAFERTYKKGKSIFVPKWTAIQDARFPAYTKFTLEVCELAGGVLIQKFTVQMTENMSVSSTPKDEIEEKIKETMTQRIIEEMLRYYMYGNVV